MSYELKMQGVGNGKYVVKISDIEAYKKEKYKL